jgi:molecular chaperone DnaJ
LSQDYYAVLGVPRTASQEEIKKAFRRLAAEHHPDKGGDAAKFKEVNAAHQVLTDEVKKAKYDLFGDENATHPPQRQPRWQGGQNFHVTVDDLNSVFSQHFDPFGPFHGGNVSDFARKTRPVHVNGEDIKVVITIPMDEALAGTKRTVQFDRGDRRPCSKCSAEGRSGGGRRPCPTCGGNGRVIEMVRGHPAARQCRSCAGSGSIQLNHCGDCSGSGSEPVQKELTVTIPKGLRHGQEMKVRGLGKVGSPPGDLLLFVEVKDSVNWWARGDVLFTTVEVGIAEMVKGGSMAVLMPDGRPVQVKIPPGGGHSVAPGAWKSPAGQDGDLNVLFRIKPAKDVSPRAERLMKELLEELEGRARRQ